MLVNYRTPELVERCLASVHADWGARPLEVVVVDNASPDGSAGRLREHLQDTKVVEMPDNLGFAAGVNAGFRSTTAETVIVLNPDTEVCSGTMTLLVEHLHDHPHAGVVAPILEDTRGSVAPNGYRRFPNLLTLACDLCVPFSYAMASAPRLHPYAMSPGELLSGRQPRHVCGAAMAIRRAAFDDAGPFDERFFLYLEETEWQGRVANRGWSIDIAPGAHVRHLVRGGGDSALAPSPHFVTSAIQYLAMHRVPRALSRAVFALALASSWLTVAGISCLPSKHETARIQTRAYRELLAICLRGAAQRRA